MDHHFCIMVCLRIFRGRITRVFRGRITFRGLVVSEHQCLKPYIWALASHLFTSFGGPIPYCNSCLY